MHQGEKQPVHLNSIHSVCSVNIPEKDSRETGGKRDEMSGEVNGKSDAQRRGKIGPD